MAEAALAENENERLALVRRLEILDSVSEEAYDGIAHIAGLICDMPISAITIVDQNRQWFKSIVGLPTKETPRAQSFCAHAILGHEILEVQDSEQDDRFKDNPLVTGDPHIRFYAGAPLELESGLRVGALCVIDNKPNKLTADQLKALRFLSLQVTALLDLRLKLKEIEALRENDSNIVNMLTHELRNPLASIKGFLSLLSESEDESHTKQLGFIEKCSKNVDRMLHIVNEFLAFSHWKDGVWSINKEENDINTCIRDSAALLRGYADKCKVTIELSLDENIPKCQFDYNGIMSVLENLISNAAKYSKENGKVILSSKLDGNSIKVEVEDFGLGISEKNQSKLFKPFALFDQENRAGIKGSGLGLSIAKKIIDQHGWELNFHSREGKGTVFYFTIPLS